MTIIHKSALVPYSAEKMYALVSDIDAYPEFLSWCGGTRIHTYEGNVVVASIDIAYSGIHKSFTTRNELDPGKAMVMHLRNGPFKRLEGVWHFDALDENACKVSLHLEFEFSNVLLRMTLGPVFESIANHLIDQFQQRAEALYS